MSKARSRELLTLSPNALLGSNAYDANFLRPYPGYGDISIHREGSYANYNSLQVSANRRFSRGFFLALAYTWSKALGLTTNDGDFVRIDGNNRHANYGPLGIDRSHTFTMNSIYQFPSLFRSNAPEVSSLAI